MKKINIYLILFSLLFLFVACSDTSDKSKDNSTNDNSALDSGSQTPDQPTSGNIPSDSTTDDKNTPDDITDTPIQDDPSDDPITPVPVGNMNPLTGLYDGISDSALNRRPVAIMVGNSLGGLPQWGVSDADIIYEMIAEARMTRLMAIFQDSSKIDKIAAIRSARPYFIDIAQSYGAVFVHFGASEPAVEQIALREDLVDIDGIKWPLEGTAFFRDPDRKKNIGSEHSVYTTGEYLEIAFAKQNKSIEQSEHPSAFNFADTSSAEIGEKMSKVQVTFKSTHKPYFVYNANTLEYERYQYQQEHIDGLNGEQISVKNLLVLRMDLSDIDHYLDIVDIKTTGEGTGYYFCEGKYIDIKWKKDAYNSPIVFYTQDGSELVCKPGKTFVSVVTLSASVEIE